MMGKKGTRAGKSTVGATVKKPATARPAGYPFKKGQGQGNGS